MSSGRFTPLGRVVVGGLMVWMCYETVSGMNDRKELAMGLETRVEDVSGPLVEIVSTVYAAENGPSYEVVANSYEGQ